MLTNRANIEVAAIVRCGRRSRVIHLISSEGFIMFYEISSLAIAAIAMITIVSIEEPISHVSMTPLFDGRILSHSISMIRAGLSSRYLTLTLEC